MVFARDKLALIPLGMDKEVIKLTLSVKSVEIILFINEIIFYQKDAKN